MPLDIRNPEVATRSRDVPELLALVRQHGEVNCRSRSAPPDSRASPSGNGCRSPADGGRLWLEVERSDILNDFSTQTRRHAVVHRILEQMPAGLRQGQTTVFRAVQRAPP
ncbi:MAG: hypothetical protein ACSLFR_02085 [Solirubrobacteraceae bacterium]